MFELDWVRTHLGVVFGDVFGLFWVISWISERGTKISKNLGKIEGLTSRRRDPSPQRRSTPRRGMSTSRRGQEEEFGHSRVRCGKVSSASPR